jgi:glycosyltransferase involved in cell wall biosynthesis
MVIESYLPATGGTERQLQQLAGALAARRVLVEILTIRRSPRWARRETVDGIPVHRLSYPKVRWLGALVVLAKAAAFLLTEGRRFDVLHVHTANLLAVVSVLVGRVSGRPVVLKTTGAWDLERGVLNPATRHRLRQRAMLAVLRHADAWIAVSAELRHAIEAAGVAPARIRVIPNGVDTARFRPVAGATGPEPRVVFVGRLVSQKALPVLLTAWSRVVDQIPGVTLDIVGAGPLGPEMQGLSARLGLGAGVRFLGFQADVQPFLERAAVFVLPSRVEGLSNALLEAMAAGIPVVATRVGGTEDVVIDGHTGLLVAPDDPEALADALVALLTARERAREMGRHGRARVMERYGLSRVADEYLAVYGDIAGHRRSWSPV